ncbi:hypothetical protein GCM10008020_17310 [Massilia psychrophila]|nr:hypothetical protein GCM10008020_17310 [Massilia psychrophila]
MQAGAHVAECALEAPGLGVILRIDRQLAGEVASGDARGKADGLVVQYGVLLVANTLPRKLVRLKYINNNRIVVNCAYKTTKY